VTDEEAPAPGPDGTSRVVLVSYLARDPFSPRGARTEAVLAELRTRSEVEVVAGSEKRVRSQRLNSSRRRRLARRGVSALLMDKFEPWSRRRFSRWHPKADGALLIGYPFSPLVYASSRLSRFGIPYVVDVGDPWALTARQPALRGLALERALHAERRLWSGARAAVVTTPAQRESLRELFSDLPILVRPNGVKTSAPTDPQVQELPRTPRARLALVHFGSLYEARLDVRPFLTRLAREGPWEGVELTQFGGDWTSDLGSLTDDFVVHVRAPVPWPQAVSEARKFDAALVIGNVDPSQLPSKVVSYLALPIPRIAVTADPDEDAIGSYLRDKSGWLALRSDAPNAAPLVHRHTSRSWSPAELAVPPSELWEPVSREIVDFVLDALRRAAR